MGDTFTTQTRRFIYISIRVFMPIGKFKHLQLCPLQMANKTSHKALSILKRFTVVYLNPGRL